MSLHVLLATLPLLLPAATAGLVMVAAAIRRHHGITAWLTVLGLGASLALVPLAWQQSPCAVGPLLLIDHYGLLCMGLVLAAALAVALFSYDYWELRTVPPLPRLAEYYLLLLLAATGGAVLVASVHFASFFLGLELLSVALFALIAYRRHAGGSAGIEAGMKYLVLAGASSAFVLFGMALVYAATGTLSFNNLTGAGFDSPAGRSLTLAGIGLIVVGVGFKLSLVPFHGWAADVYQGAPVPVTAFVATVSKGAVFALLLRYYAAIGAPHTGRLQDVLTLIALVTMFAGNWLALLQTNLKRLLAYSSIAHMGYLLVALLAGGVWGSTAVAFYLAAYFAATLGAFGVMSLLSTADRDTDALEDYRGLSHRHPWLAGILSLSLLSLAGLPLSAGFFAKFYVLAAGLSSGLLLLVVALVLNSAIGLFYYLRVIVMLFRPPSATPAAPVVARFFTVVTLAVLALILLWLGLYPTPALTLIEAALPR